MTNLALVELKISHVREYLNKLKRHQPLSVDQLTQDEMYCAAIERIVYLATQSTIEVAEVAIALKRFRRPANYGESFDILAEEQVIPGDLADKLVKMTGLRNVLTHQYRTVDYNIVAQAVNERLVDIEQFLQAIEALF